MGITINDIARIAGVSRGTVDKVLHNRPGVSAETREKVMRIIKELGYKPNLIAKSLVNSKVPVKIGVILTPSYNSFIDQVIQGIKAAEAEFADFNGKVIIKNSISLDPEEYNFLLNELEEEQVSGVVALPVEDPLFIEHINKLKHKGIEVVTFNSYIREIRQMCYVGQDHYKGGRTAAGLMSKLLPEGGDVCVIISSKFLPCHTDRLKGFRDKLNELEQKINILEVCENQDLNNVAYRMTLEFCKKYPNLKGLYLTGGGNEGAARALESINMGQRIALICHDLLPEIGKYMRNGTIDFVVDQDAFRQGYLPVKLLFEKLIKGKNPPNALIRIPITIATGDAI